VSRTSFLRRGLGLVPLVLLLAVTGVVVRSLGTAPSPDPVRSAVYAAPVADVRPAAAAPRQRAHAAGPATVSPAWVATTAAKAGIPVPALRAYARAQLMVPSSCHLGWTTLAGIGWVESQHGTLGGRTLGDDGRSSAPIVGPALSGGLDHAYGPMQFIPSTWSRWASDGDGDGVADIDDIDDAAYAAARYLCGGGYDLTTGSGWAAAIFSYNHSQDYVDQVYAAATAYDERTR